MHQNVRASNNNQAYLGAKYNNLIRLLISEYLDVCKATFSLRRCYCLKTLFTLKQRKNREIYGSNFWMAVLVISNKANTMNIEMAFLVRHMNMEAIQMLSGSFFLFARYESAQIFSSFGTDTLIPHWYYAIHSLWSSWHFPVWLSFVRQSPIRKNSKRYHVYPVCMVCQVRLLETRYYLLHD